MMEAAARAQSQIARHEGERQQDRCQTVVQGEGGNESEQGQRHQPKGWSPIPPTIQQVEKDGECGETVGLGREQVSIDDAERHRRAEDSGDRGRRCAPAPPGEGRQYDSHDDAGERAIPAQVLG